jgi:pyruvate dehydrogenase E2 component (dihydrolipoamide acetyltransferase)
MKKYTMKINNELYQARIIEFTSNHAKVEVNGVEFSVEIESDKNQSQPKIVQMEKTVPSVPQMKTGSKSANDIKAPIPGVIISVLKKEGDVVHSGDVILTLEAMKMETEIMADLDGIIEKILIKEKSPVQEGDVLVKIQALNQTVTPQADVVPKTIVKEEPVRIEMPSQKPNPVHSLNKKIIAPLPGIILDVKVKIGDIVKENQPVIILEAMKMESEIFSNASGTVKNVLVSKGENVNDGQLLIELGD